jgi:hypothetical protein
MSSEKIRGSSSTKRGILTAYPLDPVYKEIGILHEHRDNNDVFNYPPVGIHRGAGRIDGQEGSKTKHLADAFNISVEQNNRQISEVSGTFYPFWKYNQSDGRHMAASAFTHVPTSQSQSLERLQERHPPHVIHKNVANTRNPSFRPRTDAEREAVL